MEHSGSVWSQAIFTSEYDSPFYKFLEIVSSKNVQTNVFQNLASFSFDQFSTQGAKWSPAIISARSNCIDFAWEYFKYVYSVNF